MSAVKRVILIILDSMGVGELPDAAEYGDEGSNTLANTAKAVGGLSLPNMQRLGLGNITAVVGVPPCVEPSGAYGRMAEASAGEELYRICQIARKLLEHAYRLGRAHRPDGQSAAEYVRRQLDRLGLGADLTAIRRGNRVTSLPPSPLRPADS
jgi:phosphopentomutase